MGCLSPIILRTRLTYQLSDFDQPFQLSVYLTKLICGIFGSENQSHIEWHCAVAWIKVPIHVELAPRGEGFVLLISACHLLPSLQRHASDSGGIGNAQPLH